MHELEPKVTAMAAETGDARNNGYADKLDQRGRWGGSELHHGGLLESYKVDGDRRRREDALIKAVLSASPRQGLNHWFSRDELFPISRL